MTEHAAFIRAICESPDDDTPRLVLADWLDDRGEAERAEFIRVQVELARYDKMSFAECAACEVPDENYRHDDDCPRSPKHPLRRRERELLIGSPTTWGANGEFSDWLSELGVDSDPWPTWTYRRGFVAEITCSWEDWLKHADALLAAQPIQKVTLMTWPPIEEPERYRPMNVDGKEVRWSIDQDHRITMTFDAGPWRKITFVMPRLTGVRSPVELALRRIPAPADRLP